MSENNKNNHKKNGIKTTRVFFEDFAANITTLDLSNQNIQAFNEQFKLPPGLTELCLSNNDLNEIPLQVLDLRNLEKIDVSYNKIEYFDDTPQFCHSIKYINLSNNKLLSPPCWIWLKQPKHLTKLDLSFNENLTYSFIHGHLEELLQYKPELLNVKINNCQLQKYVAMLSTLSKVKCLELGSYDLNKHAYVNKLEEVPCRGLEECCDTEIINLSNTYLYCIKPSIETFKRLRVLDLSLNKLVTLPNEICNLDVLEVCILSFNSLMYLPDRFTQLNKLKTLLIDGNELCMLPNNICELPNLETLDLYDNKLYDVPNRIEYISKIDLAQNYFDEPNDETYLYKRNAIRKQQVGRLEGSKEVVEVPESYKSDSSSEMELEFSNEKEDCDSINRPLSSPEDWDSDDYWIPHYFGSTKPSQSPWVTYVKRKMAEGNFCPMDAHQVSIFEKVKYQKTLHPQIEYESDGQFDDYSGDDS